MTTFLITRTTLRNGLDKVEKIFTPEKSNKIASIVATLAMAIFDFYIRESLETTLLFSSLAVAFIFLPEFRIAGFRIYQVMRNIFPKSNSQPKEWIDFAALKKHAIDASTIATYEMQIAKKEYQKFVALAEVIAGSTEEDLRIFKNSDFFPWFAEQLMKLENNIEKELCAKLFKKFQQIQIFSWLENTIEVTCKDGQKSQISRLAMFLASPYYRIKISSSFKDNDPDTLSVVEKSSSVQTLNAFLLTETFTLNENPIHTAAEVLNLARIWLMEDFCIPALQDSLEKRSSELKTEAALGEFFDEFRDKIEEGDFYNQILDQAFTNFFKHHGGVTQFHFWDQFVIPTSAFYLLNDKSVGTWLQGKVNCISLPLDINSLDITAIKCLFLQLPGEFASKITSLAIPDVAVYFDRYGPFKPLLKEFFSLFPNINTAYRFPKDEKKSIEKTDLSKF